MIRGSIHWEDTTITCTFPGMVDPGGLPSMGSHRVSSSSNIRALKYMKQNLTKLKGEIDSKTIIVRNFNTSL